MSELECPHCARGIYEEDLGGLEQLVAQRCAPLVGAAERALAMISAGFDYDAVAVLAAALAAYRAAQGAGRET